MQWISWDDVNRTEKAGAHFVEGLGYVTIRRLEIEYWEDDPDGRFSLIPISPINGIKRYAFGSFHSSKTVVSITTGRSK
jgi:hypothetical protein